MLNSSGIGHGQAKSPAPAPALAAHNPGFEGFANLNSFTMKTLDGYVLFLYY